jgi:hypothetical protein
MEFSNLSTRLLAAIKSGTSKKRSYKELEEQTGIPSDRWSAFALGRQRPTAEMIETACKIWPEHAFWIVTGVEDKKYGHAAVAELDPNAPSTFEKDKTNATYFNELIAAYEDSDFKKSEFINKGLLVLGEMLNDSFMLERAKQTSSVQKRIKVHEEIRWLRILLEAYMPIFSADQNEPLLHFINSALDTLVEKACELDEVDVSLAMREIQIIKDKFGEECRKINPEHLGKLIMNIKPKSR